jgi:rhamnulokinase
MTTSFAAVDLGATSGRVVLGTFGPKEFTLDEVHRFANTPITIDGVLCWDVERLFNETLIGLGHAVTRAAERRSTLSGIAVDSWGVDYGLVDDTTTLVAPVRHYRATTEQVVQQSHARVSAREAYARTGITELAINTCFQFMRDAEQGLLQPGVTALLTPDLWTAWLTGVHGAERTIASTTGLLDWDTLDWAHDLMARYGIAPSIVAPIAQTGSRAGVTLPAINERIGASAPIPVYRAPAHDTASAFASVTSADAEAAVISCGTWALVGCLNAKPVLNEQAEEARFTNEVAADGSVLLVRNLSGTWLLEECLRTWAADSTHDNDLHELRSRLLHAAADDAAMVAGTIDCGDPVLISTRDMPAELSDLYLRAHGAADLTQPQIVRLILESLAESFATTISRTSDLTGKALREVIMIGGGSRIELLVSLTERATGLPVRVSHQEATSIGNICVQAVSAGVFASIDQARAAVNAHPIGSSHD